MQECAKLAWDCVEEVEQGATEKGQYSTVARRLPSMLQTNGLGQTLAFLRAHGENKPGDHHTVIYNHLSRWLQKQLVVDPGEDMCHWVITHSSAKYRRATVEAIAFAVWLRRFAEAKVWNEAGGEE
jgi:CRISPR-associated protein Cmr5